MLFRIGQNLTSTDTPVYHNRARAMNVTLEYNIALKNTLILNYVSQYHHKLKKYYKYKPVKTHNVTGVSR